jgi:hypothetical protein
MFTSFKAKLAPKRGGHLSRAFAPGAATAAGGGSGASSGGSSPGPATAATSESEPESDTEENTNKSNNEGGAASTEKAAGGLDELGDLAKKLDFGSVEAKLDSLRGGYDPTSIHDMVFTSFSLFSLLSLLTCSRYDHLLRRYKLAI